MYFLRLNYSVAKLLLYLLFSHSYIRKKMKHLRQMRFKRHVWKLFGANGLCTYIIYIYFCVKIINDNKKYKNDNQSKNNFFRNSVLRDYIVLSGGC